MIASVVIHGDGLGKQSGYPTANLNIPKNQVPFAAGVYAAYTTLNHRTYPSALVIQDSPWKIEVHVMDYAGPDFYGSRIEVVPVQKVSEIERYDSSEELKAKIEGDVGLIRELFAERASNS